jgi:hypothetical protein
MQQRNGATEQLLLPGAPRARRCCCRRGGGLGGKADTMLLPTSSMELTSMPERRHGAWGGRFLKISGVGGGELAESDTERVRRTRGSVAVLLAHLGATVALGVVSTINAANFEGRAPFSSHNVTAADIAEAALAGHPYTPAQIAAMNADGFSMTYCRLTSYLVFLALSFAHRWLVDGVSRRDPIAIGHRHAEHRASNASKPAPDESFARRLWAADAKDDVEYAALELFVWLCFPLGVSAVALVVVGETASMGGRVLSAVVTDLFPILTIAATTLLVETQCVTLRRHVEDTLTPYVDPEPLPRSPWVQWLLADTTPPPPHRPHEELKTAEQLLSDFRKLTRELESCSGVWRSVLGTQVCLVCALVINATASLLTRHGFQVSLLTGQPLSDGMALMYLVQTMPVLWALWLSFSTVVHLNTYLDEVPARITRNCRDENLILSMAERCQFAEEYQRLGVHFSVPAVGKLTTSTRMNALLSFVGTLSLALAFPGQVIDTLGL